MGGVPYKVIFFKVVMFMIEAVYNYKLLPQDFADSLASHLSAVVTACLFLLVMARLFFGAALECLTPAEWPESWEKSAEAFCYTDGTYAIPYANANKTDGTEWSVKLRLGYYYWTPYILIGHAVILKAPDFFWHYLCDLHPKKPIETLRAFAYLIGSQELTRQEAECEEARQTLKKLANCIERQRWSDTLAGHLLSRNQSVNFDHYDLLALYMAFKAIRLAALLLSLLYLKASFGLDSVLFGAVMARNSLRGATWEETGLFPRWAYCDVHIRPTGQWNTMIAQCALPVNMLTEKVLLFLWLWTVCCAGVLICSAVVWCLKMLPSRRRDFALAFLAIGGSGGHVTQERRKRLLADSSVIEELSAIDRAFTLRLVEERLGLAAVYLAMDSMMDEQIQPGCLMRSKYQSTV